MDDRLLWEALSHEEKEEVKRHYDKNRSPWGQFVSNAYKQITSTAKSPLRSTVSLDSSHNRTFPSFHHRAAARTSLPESANLSEFGIEGVHIADDDNDYNEEEDPSTTMLNAPLISDLECNQVLPAQIHQEGHSSSKSCSENSMKQGQYVLLKKFRRKRPFLNDEGWGSVSNLDLFFTSIYNYYYHRGIIPIICKGVVDLVSLFFTLYLSVFLFAYLDVFSLATCKDEQSCLASLSDYTFDKPFSHASTLWNNIVKLYIMLFLIYGFISIASFITTLRDAIDAKCFYENELGISDRRLAGGAIEWDEIAQKIIKLHESGEFRVSLQRQDINALTISQRILRKENWMVGLLNCGVLDLKIPLPFFISTTGRSNSHFLSTSLEWSIYLCVFGFMYNHNYRVRPSFIDKPLLLQQRFVLCGIVQLLLMPFLLLFMILHFLLSNLYDWRSTKNYMGPRIWSGLARWRFREFNELPHFFERRLSSSYSAADDYLKLFAPSIVVTSIGRLIVFLSGSLLASLFLFGAIDDSILLHVKFSNWNLLWYIGILGVIFSVGKSLIPDQEVHKAQYHKNYFEEMNNALYRVASHTHYFPEKWKGMAWKGRTHKEFTSLFVHQSQLFVIEMLSVVLTPLVLCISLRKCAPEICDFIRRSRVDEVGIGEICGFSTFNFDLFKDRNWQGSTDIESPVIATNEKANSRPRTNEGKIEKSFFSFKANHPSWSCNVSGQSLVDRVEEHHAKQQLLLANERRLHIEAAAKQLELLLHFEQTRNSNEMDEKLTKDKSSDAMKAFTSSYLANSHLLGEQNMNDISFLNAHVPHLSDNFPNLSTKETAGDIRSMNDNVDSMSTLRILLSHRGTVWPRVLPLCILTVVLTNVIYYLKEEDVVDLTFSLDGHKLLSIMVAYLVVSRADASYERFWEARSLLSVALQSMRQLSIHAAAFTNRELHGPNADKVILWRTMLRQHMIHMLHSAVMVIKEEEHTYDFIGVKNEGDDATESPLKKSARRFESIPGLSYAIHKEIVLSQHYLDKPLTILHENRLHNFLLEFEQTVCELCKFAATPYPFPVTQMTRFFLFFWMFTLPFALVNKAEEVYTTSVLVFFITYGFFGLEFVSIELDDPFGDDLNDLPIEDFAKVVVKGINDDLSSESAKIID